ncbi:hypothetical protein TNCV_1075911 [Trichonephila clavipes]|uniref:Uncharacterized protein n=1 Tax=Trichonephila clavipes TaxID=2585209 RepID=A0A8X6T0U8_TRICX|nr:hypothetical protein TNCV_1075911 [Trichonephila clavipes]
MHVKYVKARTSSRGVVWKLEEGVPAQMPSSSLDYGSRLRGLPSIALGQPYSHEIETSNLYLKLGRWVGHQVDVATRSVQILSNPQNVWKKETVSLQEVLDLLQKLLSEINDALTDDFSDEEISANYLLEFSLDSEDDDQKIELKVQ